MGTHLNTGDVFTAPGKWMGAGSGQVQSGLFGALFAGFARALFGPVALDFLWSGLAEGPGAFAVVAADRAHGFEPDFGLALGAAVFGEASFSVEAAIQAGISDGVVHDVDPAPRVGAQGEFPHVIPQEAHPCAPGGMGDFRHALFVEYGGVEDVQAFGQSVHLGGRGGGTADAEEKKRGQELQARPGWGSMHSSFI